MALQRSRVVFCLMGLAAIALAGWPVAARAADAPPASVSFARAADIQGNPVAFELMPPPAPASEADAKGKGGVAEPAKSGGLVWPMRLPVSGAILTSRAGMRWHPLLGGYRQHYGSDLAVPYGSPVVAPASGTVVAAGWNGGYGLFVAVDHGNGLVTRYGHLAALGVRTGQKVAAGATLGMVGSTGLSTGPHLHYEMWYGNRPLDPVATAARAPRKGESGQRPK